MWKTTMHSHAVKVDGQLRAWIEQQMLQALGGLGRRIGHVHVRLYGETGGTSLCTCYVRVEFVPTGGVALGETASDPTRAVARTMARIGVAVRRQLEERQEAAVRGTAATAIIAS